MISFTSTLRVNALFWISSLKSGEEGTTRRVTEDLTPFFNSIGLSYQYWTPRSAAELDTALDTVAHAATEGMCPILHFDTHGSDRLGLHVADSGEFVSWGRLIQRLRTINVATKNNLCVVSACCFGFHAIKALQITEPCPFYILIAPEHEITFGFIEDNIFRFYQDAFIDLDIETYELHLSAQMRLFHCEKSLAIVLSRYIGDSCIGKGGDLRRERLLTDVLASGVPNNRANKRMLRKSLKHMTRPTQALLDRLVDTFLIGKPVGFNIDDLMKFAVSAKRAQARVHNP
jgi:hypothetical protein